MSTQTFEDRLLEELQREARLQGAGADSRSAVVPVRRRLVTPVRAGAVLAACAAATVAAIVVPGGDGGSSAYAVERLPGGQVRVTVNDLTLDTGEQDALADKLRAAGVRVSVDELPKGKVCDMPRGKMIGNTVISLLNAERHDKGDGADGREKVKPGPAGMREGKPGGPYAKVWKLVFHRGDTMVMERGTGFYAGNDMASTSFYGIRGKAAPCEPVPSPRGSN
ncbi:hypothetical protein C9F11_04690 [Streptomyces sp. YIM 121038]|uniref:hypothetical protein n=1 Tax=Streptomyces sp. YIM 121038 TaxID=2136401 RepID=UPI001110CB4A|nr:hypothetical protein [Streptomyces sp. YIM 121038]QCX74641.1 hypothetical protein C9F11_04690 [Streptomyces sp. YIM 121038]